MGSPDAALLVVIALYDTTRRFPSAARRGSGAATGPRDGFGPVIFLCDLFFSISIFFLMHGCRRASYTKKSVAPVGGFLLLV